MRVDELDVTSSKLRKRVGRGIGSGKGKTAGRGTKGQKSRSGYKTKPGFEGGQTPLVRRIPKKRGFKSRGDRHTEVGTGILNALGVGKIDNNALFERGIIRSPKESIKVILTGDVSKKLDISLQAISAGAEKAVQAKGGTFKKTGVPSDKKVKTKEKKK